MAKDLVAEDKVTIKYESTQGTKGLHEMKRSVYDDIVEEFGSIKKWLSRHVGTVKSLTIKGLK